MKKLLLGLLIALMLLGSASADGDNLLKNGSFETINAAGMPDDWYTVSYDSIGGNTQFSVTDEQAHSGSYSAKIVNQNLNDARFVTVANVKPESVYRLSGYILVEDIADAGAGANFALEEVYARSDGVYDTNGQWRYVEWYGETNSGQTSVEIGIRLGGYGSESSGTAYFDDLRLEKVDSVPTDVYADLWFSYTVHDDTMAQQALGEEASESSKGWFILLGLLFLALVSLGMKTMLAGDTKTLQPKQDNVVIGVFALAMVAAFALRLILAGTIYGYEVDIGCFSAWSQRIATVGPINFYTSDYFCDYPPGYMLLLWPVGQLKTLLGSTDSAGVLILLKSIPILCDMITAMLLFAYAKKRLPLKAAAFVGLFFAFNPAVLATGSAWGQVDSVLTLLIVIAAIQAMKHRWRIALPAYVLAVLVKPQALLFGPVALAWLLVTLIKTSKTKRKAQWTQLWQGIVLAIVAAAAVVLPFQLKQNDPLWLFKLYEQTLSSYNYAVLNTANLAFLLKGNWSPLSADIGIVKQLSQWIPVITGIALLSFGLIKLNILTLFKGFRARLQALWLELKSKETGSDDSRKLSLALLCAVFGLAFLLSAFWPSTFLLYGTMWMVCVYTAVLVLLIVERKTEALPFYMALMLIGVYVLGLKIHERYLFAATALLPLAYIGTKDKRLLWLCAGLSVTTFINIAIVLDNSILLGAAGGHLSTDTNTVNILLCIANLLLCGYAAIIAYTGLKPSKPTSAEVGIWTSGKENHRNRLLHPKDARLHVSTRDVLIMGLTFVVYCVVAFTNLGSTKAPQTAWVAASAEDQVVLELEENTTFSMLYYAGVSYNNFTVSVSDDGETWSDPTICRMRQGLCYRWLYATTALTDDINSESFASDSLANIVWFSGKYLRIHAEFTGLNLWEVVLRDESGNRIPVSLVSGSAADAASSAANLIDEQDTITGEPSAFNGTYFDEIYHARTAYEHLHGQAPYETSHPPLGKEIMSIGIAIFGMTPFGWRFMGTLFGALMLPAMYLFGLQLTGKRKFAAFAMLLMSLDLMHFTQTRIATIDSFPTLFILLSYLCMARYILSDPFAVSAGKPRVLSKQYLKSLIPLLLSGVFIGCAIAAKWIGLYAGAGLAVLFFYGIYRQFRAGLMAYEQNPDNLSKAQADRVLEARAMLLKRIFATLGFCVLFFLVIPAVIYYLSYIPYLAPTGAVNLQRLWRAQEGMLAYHSTPGLGMDHPFYSPWWQWPLIIKPMWYAKAAFVAAGYGANIVCLGNPAVFYLGAISMIAVFVLLFKKYVRPQRHNSGGRKWIVYVVWLMCIFIMNTVVLNLIMASISWNQAKQYMPYYAILINVLLDVPLLILIFKSWKNRRSILGNNAALVQVHPQTRNDDPAPAILAISFMAQYLPWVLVPRSMFIYHYFASLPFIILATMLMAKYIKSEKLKDALMIALLAIALVLFIMFYPYASGLTVSSDYMQFLHWFPNLPV